MFKHLAIAALAWLSLTPAALAQIGGVYQDQGVRALPTLNVKRYGARGDGSTDDSGAFATALAACDAAGGCQLEVPAATYAMAAQVSYSASNKIVLKGSGRGASTLVWSNSSGGLLLTYATDRLAPAVRGLSLRTSYAASFTATVTIASPSVFTKSAHALVNGSVVQFTTTGSLPTGLATGTFYYVVNATANTFQVSATAGGSAINTRGTQSGTHTVLSGGGTALTIQGPVLSTSQVAGVDVEDVEIAGTGNAYWTGGVYLLDCWYPSIRRFAYRGSASDAGLTVLPFHSSFGVKYERTEALYMRDFTMFWAEDAVLQAGTTFGEGLDLMQFEIVAVRRGVNATSWTSGAVAIQGIQNGHINAYEKAISLAYVVQPHLGGLLLYKTNLSHVAYVGINLVATANARIVDTHFNDDPSATGTYTGIVLSGTSINSTIRGNTFDNAAAASTAIVLGTGAANNIIADNIGGGQGAAVNTVELDSDAGAGNVIERNISASGSAVTDNSSASQFVGANFPDAAWKAYMPVVTCASGNITKQGTVTGRYKRLGSKLYFVEMIIPITTNGTCASFLIVTLPNSARAAAYGGGITGSEIAVNNKAVVGRLSTGSNTIYVFNADGTYPGVSGGTFVLNGTFEAQ
jgi:hypothetical protein